MFTVLLTVAAFALAGMLAHALLCALHARTVAQVEARLDERLHRL